MDVGKVTGSLKRLSPQGEEKLSKGAAVVERDLEVLPKEVPSEEVQEVLSEENLSRLVEQVNTLMEALSIEARFSVHQPTHAIVVTLINRDTGEIVRQIPPEKLLDMVARLRELAGLFVDEVV